MCPTVHARYMRSRGVIQYTDVDALTFMASEEKVLTMTGKPEQR